MLEPLYRKVGDRYIVGKGIIAFIHNGNRYYLTHVVVFQDGVIYCIKPMSFNDFKAEVRKGWITSELPEGALLSVRPGFGLTAFDVVDVVEDEEFIKEVEDIIRELNGEVTTVQQCREALRMYHDSPSSDRKRRLSEAYL